LPPHLGLDPAKESSDFYASSASQVGCRPIDFDPIPNLYLGTSNWSAESWVGPFCSHGTPPAEFLPVYATQFRTAEIDSPYYCIRSSNMVQGWRDRARPGFVFAAKFPQDVTHKKLFVDCERKTEEFLGVMELLDEKLGPISLQLPYPSQEVILSAAFFDRLAWYRDHLLSTHRYALEIRNRN
jgi:uncharacterized protein YecE (DUF72 family)